MYDIGNINLCNVSIGLWLYVSHNDTLPRYEAYD